MKAEVRPLTTMKKWADLATSRMQDARRSSEPRRLVVWTNAAWMHIGFSEIFETFDLKIVMPEVAGVIYALSGISTELCQRADALGYQPEICSVGRTLIGSVQGTPASEWQMLPAGGMPKPDLLLCVPFCTTTYKTYEMWSLFFDVPMFIWHNPRKYDGLSKEEIAHLVREATEQLRDMVTFLERVTGCHLDYDRLNQLIMEGMEKHRLWGETMEMCRNIPAPMSAFDAFGLYGLEGATQGHEGLSFFQELNSEVAERVAQRMGVLSEEKYRLYWVNLPSYTKIPELSQKFASYGAVPVVSEMSYVPSTYRDFNFDPERPLEYLVKCWFYIPQNQGVKWRIEYFTKMVEHYSIDGIVMNLPTRDCEGANPGQEDIMKALVERTGLPMVVLEADIFDSRFYSDSEVDSKIDAFMEILEQQCSQRK